MKKTILSLLLVSIFTLSAHAQTNVPQGGTGLTSAASGTVLMGNTSLRMTAVSTSTFSTLLDLVRQAREAFSTTATGLTYAASTGILSLTSGYNIPLTASTTNWNGFYDTPSTRITAGTNMSWAGNTLNGIADSVIRGLFSNSATGLTYTSGTGATSLTAGYNIPLTASTTNWNSFWDTPSTRITAGANCSWSTNTFNCSGGAGGATTTINGASGPAFTFTASSTGATDFAISTSTGAVIFHIPDASATARGLLSTTTQTIAGAKTFTGANAYGTPASITLTNGTGLPVSTGISGLATGIATWLATPSSANLLSALTTKTGTGLSVFDTSPTLVTPILGTPTSVTLTNGTGLPISTGVSGLGTGIATWLATPSSANLATALTTKAGSGLAVFDTSPTIVTPTIAKLANLTTNGFVKTSGSDGTLSVDTATYATAAGTLGFVPRWTSASALGTGLIRDNGTVAGINATSSSYTFNLQGTAATNPFNVASSSGTSIFSTTAFSNILMGTTTESATNKERLKIDAGTATNSGMALWGSVNDYFQSVVTNMSTGINAESGFTAQNASSTATDRFAWFGINGSNYGTSTTYSTGWRSDVTLIGRGNHMFITNASTTGNLYFMTGGTATSTNTRMTITSAGNVGVASTSPTNTFSVNGTVGITGKTDMANASSTALTATTLHSTTATITKNNVTNASTTNETISGALHDSVGAIGTSGQVLQSTGTSTKWTTSSGGGTKLDIATTTIVSPVNTVAEGTAYTYSVPAGTLGTANAVRVTVHYGTIQQFSTNTWTIRFKYGGTTLHTFTIGGTESLVMSGKIEVILASSGTTGTQTSTAIGQIGAGGYIGNGNLEPQYWSQSSKANSTIDSTAAQDFLMTVQSSQNNGGQAFSTNLILVEKIQ